MQHNKEAIKVTLKITNEIQITKIYEDVDLKDSLYKYIEDFAEYIKADYHSLYVLYNGKKFIGDSLGKSLDEIINGQDRIDGIMSLLVYQITEFDIAEEDDIIIILSIESTNIIKLKGKRREILKNKILNHSFFKLYLKWCIFKYGENEIDLNQTFDDIANGDDKKNLKIEIIVNFKAISGTVNFISEKGNIFSYKCSLNDWVDSKFDYHCQKISLVEEDYNLVYNDKILDSKYIKFSSLIFNNNPPITFKDEDIKSTKLNDTSNYNKEDTNVAINNITKKENFNSIIQNHGMDEVQFEIVLRVVKKCWCIIFKRQMSDSCKECCSYCKYGYNDCKDHCNYSNSFCRVMLYLFGFASLFFMCGGWYLFTKKK